MKKIIFLSVFILIFSCSKNDNSHNKDGETTETKVPKKAVSDPIAEGKSLVEEADCLGCHNRDEKLIGPSYKDVAEKYQNTPQNIEYLAGKILNGSSGIWGDVPMPPHSLSKENAKYMAQYILSSK